MRHHFQPCAVLKDEANRKSYFPGVVVKVLKGPFGTHEALCTIHAAYGA
jgi:hypothetical protein